MIYLIVKLYTGWNLNSSGSETRMKYLELKQFESFSKSLSSYCCQDALWLTTLSRLAKVEKMLTQEEPSLSEWTVPFLTAPRNYFVDVREYSSHVLPLTLLTSTILLSASASGLMKQAARILIYEGMTLSILSPALEKLVSSIWYLSGKCCFPMLFICILLCSPQLK